ncbi:MAG: 7,8-didemethyl-8-hydroxy-5-deazariboflavin synthase subunit CofG [Methanosarcinales archaeon]|nr:7,8-didemethyl-8-hydroxy-5-deazariboflavin synthase subunit CofG [Methanosarcinales archaeon]
MARVVTFSRNVFIPVTDLCRNLCGYCSFRRPPDRSRVIPRREALQIISQGAESGCSEALFSMGDRPWEVAGRREELLHYLVELCELALEAGLLPHTNAGILEEDELRLLAPYNASMGLMLETTAQVPLHLGSPGKVPRVRIEHLERAGRLQIPFTTGLLLGIGESREDRAASLEVIARLHRTHGHIQEVIIQGLDPKPGTEAQSLTPPGIQELAQTVALARRILPPEVAVQVPPNLADPRPLVKAGASDLGGISPVTPDWINPRHPWPSLERLRERLSGCTLRERLPVYPGYVLAGKYGSRAAPVVALLADGDGYRRPPGS